MAKALKSLLNIGLVLFFIVIFSAEAQAEVIAPKIIKLLAQESLSLTGTAPANSEILIYLDGNFVGRAETTFSRLGSARAESAAQLNWRFQSDLIQTLAEGSHVVMAVAQDRTSLVLSAPTSEIKFTVNIVPAPILIAPNEKTATANLKPLITGLTRDNSLVKIFIDGVYNGATGVLRDDSGTANFAYRPTLNLNRGWHKIQAQALSGEQSSLESNTLNFNIELPMPAPTIFKPVANRETSVNRPFIVGLAKNDSRIKIYIDKKYAGELLAKNHLSGTANFAYKPAVALTRGAHSVYTVAVDKRGKASSRSNIVDFSTKNSAIAQSAEEEKKEAIAKIKDPPRASEIKSEPVVISESSGAVIEKAVARPVKPTPEPVMAPETLESINSNLTEKERTIKQELKDKETAALEKVKNLIGTGTAETKSDRGMINEGKENQGRLKLDLILFILFLLGVVAWLLWVNRELVKERRAQTEAEDKLTDDKDYQPGRGRDNKLF